MDEKHIGEVTHFFNKAMVMVVKLEEELAVGDRIKVARGKNEFEQTVESMQVEHEDVASAGAGDEVAVKVDNPVKEGDAIYKI